MDRLNQLFDRTWSRENPSNVLPNDESMTTTIDSGYVQSTVDDDDDDTSKLSAAIMANDDQQHEDILGQCISRMNADDLAKLLQDIVSVDDYDGMHHQRKLRLFFGNDRKDIIIYTTVGELYERLSDDVRTQLNYKIMQSSTTADDDYNWSQSTIGRHHLSTANATLNRRFAISAGTGTSSHRHRRREMIYPLHNNDGTILTWRQYGIELLKQNGISLFSTNRAARAMKKTPNNVLNDRISLYYGDITELSVDAIVNPCKRSMLPDDYDDARIYQIAGPALLAMCRELAPCEVGQVKLTPGYALPAKYIIHTVGPSRLDAQRLSRCYENSLNLAKHNCIATIAFPCIASSIYPNDKAARIALRTVRQWLDDDNNAFAIDRIIFSIASENQLMDYQRLMLFDYFPLETTTL